MSKIYEKLIILKKTGFFHIFASSLANKIVSFLSSIVLVRILSRSEYGVFTYAWNIYSIVLLANGFGMETGILQICSEHSGEEKFTHRVCNYGTRYGVIVDFGLTLVLAGIAIFAPLSIEKSRSLIGLLCLLPIIQLIYNITTAYMRSQKKNQDFAKLSLINTILIFIMSVGGAYLFRQKGMVIGYYISYITTILVGRYYFKIKLIAKVRKPEITTKKTLKSIAFVSMCNNGLSQLMYLLDVFVLGIVAADETVLASYKAATLVPTALTFIPIALMTYVYPYFAEHRNDGKWCLKKYKQILMGIGGFNIIISFGLFMFAPVIIYVLYGTEYSDAVAIFRILSINYFFSGTFRILSGNLLVTQRKLKFNLLVALVSGSVNVVADFAFIKLWGAVGAAYATVLVVLVSSFMSTVYLIKTFKRKAVMLNEGEY